MLISSRFPLNNLKEGGLNALTIVARDPDNEAFKVGENIIKKGGDVLHLTN